jgi:hypothetical protein
MWEDKERRKEETQKALESMPVALMKNFDGSIGMGSFNSGKYKVVKDGTKAENMMTFDTIDELSDAGWTITT